MRTAFAHEHERRFGDFCTTYAPGVEGTVPPLVALLNDAGLLATLLLCGLSVVYAFRERQYAWLAVTPLTFIVVVIGLLASFVMIPHQVRGASTCGAKGDTMMPPTILWPHYVDLTVIVAAPFVAAFLIALALPKEWTR